MSPRPPAVHMVSMTALEAFAHYTDGETVADLVRTQRGPYFDLDEATAKAGNRKVGQVILTVPSTMWFAMSPAEGMPLLMRFRDFPGALSSARGLGLNPGSAIKVIDPTGGEIAFHSGTPLSMFITSYAPLCDGEPS